MKKAKPTKIKSSIQRFLLLVSVLVGLGLIAGIWLVVQGRAETPREAPEAQKVLDVQANMPFQILIPAYLPEQFIREEMEIDVTQAGPGGEPMVLLTYRTRQGQTMYLKEWVPVNPDKEVLASSRPIQTEWGNGWLLRQGTDLIAIWVDIGPLRVSIYTINQDVLPTEELLAAAETLGPASNRQVFSFIVDPPEIRAVEPPPPVEASLNAEGVQEIDLIVTPGGYDPLRISVQKGVPVRLTFRQLGRVGCGNELNFPVAPGEYNALELETAEDIEVLEFTPQAAGSYEFFCAHLMYKGILVVRE
jgi:hypothetical protein